VCVCVCVRVRVRVRDRKRERVKWHMSRKTRWTIGEDGLLGKMAYCTRWTIELFRNLLALCVCMGDREREKVRVCVREGERESLNESSGTSCHSPSLLLRNAMCVCDRETAQE